MTRRAFLPILAGALTLAATAWAGEPPSPADPQPSSEGRGGGKAARGLVLDGEGRPVVGAEARFERSPWEGISDTHPDNKVWADRGLHRAITGPDGRFEAALPMSVFDLEIRGSGFAPFYRWGLRISLNREAVDLGTLRLQPGVSLPGRVTDPQRRPIPGAAVWFLAQATAPATNSGPDGRFVLRDLDPQETLRLLVCLPGYLSEAISVEPSTPEIALVVLEPGSRIDDCIAAPDGSPVSGAEVGRPEKLSRIPRYPVRGRVLDPDGQPLAGARVREVGGGPSTMTAGDGSFVLALNDGIHRLEILAEGYAPAWRTVQVAGGPVDRIDLRLSRGITLTGRILGVAPEELAGATILAISRGSTLLWATTVDPEGWYRLPGLVPGEWDVAASTSQGDRHEKLILAAGEEERDLDIVIPAFFEVRGRVIGPEDEPVARASVQFNGPESGAYLITEADGSFSTDLEEGTYQVKADGRTVGYLEAVALPLELHGPVDGIEIQLPKAGLEGQHRSGRSPSLLELPEYDD
jgi:hypothetical protein